MQSTRFPRITRILVLLAMFQAIAPVVAAVADAWRMDERTPYAHLESETGKEKEPHPVLRRPPALQRAPRPW